MEPSSFKTASPPRTFHGQPLLVTTNLLFRSRLRNKVNGSSNLFHLFDVHTAPSLPNGTRAIQEFLACGEVKVFPTSHCEVA